MINGTGSQKMRASLVAELVKNPPAIQETLVRFLGWEDPLENGGPPPPVFLGFPSGSDVNNLPAMWETGVDPWVGKIPWRRALQPTPVFLPGESMDRGAS